MLPLQLLGPPAMATGMGLVLGFDRQEGRAVMRFGFCNPPARHQELVEKLQRMPDVLDLKVE